MRSLSLTSERRGELRRTSHSRGKSLPRKKRDNGDSTSRNSIARRRETRWWKSGGAEYNVFAFRSQEGAQMRVITYA